MSILKQARLVKGQKRGRWMYYRKAGSDSPHEVRLALGMDKTHACSDHRKSGMTKIN